MDLFVDLERSPSYQLWQAANAWQRRVRKALEPFGITHAQFVILSSVQRLGRNAECVTQAHLSRFAITDENMTSQIVRSLESRGLLVRIDHPTDRRAHCLKLTEEGETMMRESRVVALEAKDSFFAPAGDRIETLVDILSDLNKAAESSCPRLTMECGLKIEDCG